MKLTPKNWTEFQHYKDRSPPWIRLHRKLLDNKDFNKMQPMTCKVLILLWLLAAETTEGTFNGDHEEIAFRVRLPVADVASSLQQLMGLGFIVEANDQELKQKATHAQQKAELNGFGSRHISDVVKRAVWARDGGKCKECAAVNDIEYDHIYPVSKGGDSSQGNIQLLCRTCNRKKRTKTAQQHATHAQSSLNMRTSETETETETETEVEPSALVGTKAPTPIRPDCPYVQIADCWNRVCQTLPKIKKVEEWAESRRRALRSRWADKLKLGKYADEKSGIEYWENLFAYVEESDFLCGRNGDWRADFDWVVNATNLSKIIEGKYANKAKQGLVQ